MDTPSSLPGFLVLCFVWLLLAGIPQAYVSITLWRIGGVAKSIAVGALIFTFTCAAFVSFSLLPMHQDAQTHIVFALAGWGLGLYIFAFGVGVVYLVVWPVQNYLGARYFHRLHQFVRKDES